MRRPVQGIAAVAAAFAVAALTAGQPGLAAPRCTGADLRVVPQYDASRPGPGTPEDAVAGLLRAGVVPGVVPDDLDAMGGPTMRTAEVGDELRVQVAQGGDVLGLARVLPHPAGGWRVEGLWTCGQVAS